jgi:hypothetical protein
MTLEDYHKYLSEHDYTSDSFEDWQEKLADAVAVSLGV